LYTERRCGNSDDIADDKSEPLSPYETLIFACSRLEFLNSAHMSQELRATIKDLALHLLF
jgi:hypothetical protein